MGWGGNIGGDAGGILERSPGNFVGMDLKLYFTRGGDVLVYFKFIKILCGPQCNVSLFGLCVVVVMFRLPTRYDW